MPTRTHHIEWRKCTRHVGICAWLIAALASVAGARSPEAAFMAENAAAMTKMHRDMHVASSGDVDRDFAAMMIPHHQGAIDMAQAVLRYGRDQQMRRLAQEIIVEQQQEIAIMRQLLDQPQSTSEGKR